MVQTTQNFELYIKSKQINIHSNSITLYGTKLHLTSPLCNSDSFHGKQIHLLSCQLSKTFLPPLSIRGRPLRKSFSLLRSKFYLLRVEPFSKGALCTGKWSKLYPFVRMAKKTNNNKKNTPIKIYSPWMVMCWLFIMMILIPFWVSSTNYIKPEQRMSNYEKMFILYQETHASKFCQVPATRFCGESRKVVLTKLIPLISARFW